VKTERGRIQGLPKFMRCSQLSQERLKLWTSNLAGTFADWLRAKGHKKFWRQRGVGVSRGCPIFCVPPISSGTLKAMNFKFGRNIRRLNPSKRPLKISETRGLGRSQGLWKIYRAAIYRAHRAVVFAIAQLSCFEIAMTSQHLYPPKSNSWLRYW